MQVHADWLQTARGGNLQLPPLLDRSQKPRGLEATAKGLRLSILSKVICSCMSGLYEVLSQKGSKLK